MYKDVLNAIDGAAVFPLISLCIFFLFFVLMIIYVFTRDTKMVNEMALLPLGDDAKQDGEEKNE
jgi:cbb3-type cytochrome oxidase subunit 3